MAADGDGFEPVSADAWRKNVPDDLQEIMARARGRMVERVRHALTHLPEGKPLPRGESRWRSAGYRKLKTYGKNEDTTRAFCTWEHNADGFKDVPEAVSVLRLPCSVEHVREICCRWEETQLGRELRESVSRPGVQSAVRPVRKRVQVALDVQQALHARNHRVGRAEERRVALVVDFHTARAQPLLRVGTQDDSDDSQRGGILHRTGGGR